MSLHGNDLRHAVAAVCGILARLESRLTPAHQAELERLTGVGSLVQLVRDLRTSVERIDERDPPPRRRL